MANKLRTSGVFNLGSLGGDAAGAGGDADFDSVVLLLDGDGTSGSTTFTDKSSSSHTITASGDTQVDTAVKKFGTGSIEFDGATDHLSATSGSEFTFGTGDFTIEAWVKFRNGASDRDMTLFDNGAVNTAGHLCIFADVNNLYCRFGTSGATLTTSWTALGINNNDWFHLAIVRGSGTCRVFVNGAQKNSGTRSENLTATGCRIGTLSGYESFYAFDGYLDDIRVTKGVARYTSSFTPPIAALPTTGTVAGATKPTRKWGGLVGRSILVTPTDAAAADITGAEILLVGGGGAGGGRIGGGGGAGAMIELTSQTLTTGQSYSLTVGAGGLGKVNTAQPDDGGDTTGFTYTATGGGYGGVYEYYSGNSGGSGGGGSGLALASNPYTTGGATDDSSYGNNGGNGAGTSTQQLYCAGGGGGHSGAGANGNSSTGVGGIGGTAKQWAVDSQYHAGGGQGAPHHDTTNPATSYGAGAGNDNSSNATTRDATSHGTNGGYGNGGGGYRNVSDDSDPVDRGGNGYQGVIKIWVPIDGYTGYTAGTPANVSSSALTYSSTVGTLLTVTGDTTLTFN